MISPKPTYLPKAPLHTLPHSQLGLHHINLGVGLGYNDVHRICKLFQSFGSIIILQVLENISIYQESITYMKFQGYFYLEVL